MIEAMDFFVGITGASGVRLGVRLVEELSSRGTVHVAYTPRAQAIAGREGEDLKFSSGVRIWSPEAMEAPVSSGSFRLEGTVIVPCSMGTMGRIASGISSTLIERVADVALKEKWPLILVPRETPLNLIHLENMVRLVKAGAVILPPVLTYYHGPRCIEDVEDFILGKVMDQLGIEHSLFRRWGDET